MRYRFSVNGQAPHLWRDDGDRWTRNKDGTYSQDNSIMDRPHKHEFERLMYTGMFSVCPPTKTGRK